MKEKKRYEILYDGLIYDNNKKQYLFAPSLLRKENVIFFCDLLNQQDKRIKELKHKTKQLKQQNKQIKELQQENQQLKKQINELQYREESYISTMRYLNKIRSELLNLPKKIVEEIRDNMSKIIIEKQIKWGDNIQIGFICNAINECLDTILEKFGDKNESNND